MEKTLETIVSFFKDNKIEYKYETTGFGDIKIEFDNGIGRKYRLRIADKKVTIQDRGDIIILMPDNIFIATFSDIYKFL